MRVAAILVLLVTLGTGCPDSGETMPDGSVPIDGPPDAAPGTICFAFGEACKSDPYPANTVCHGGDGWCIDDVCRPMCSSATRICDALVFRYAPAGAGYCEPR